MSFRPGRTPDAPRTRTTTTRVALETRAVATRPTEPGGPREVISARNHLLGLYLLLGMTISSWLARLPTVRDSLDLTMGDLGSVMLLGAVGSLVTILVAGAVVTRVGPRRTMLTSALLFSVGYVLLGLGPALGRVDVLAVGVVVFSVAIALGNVPLNVESVVIERRMGRTVVPQFHAGFSVGAVLGSALGAAAAWAAVPVVVQFGVVAILALLWRVHSVPRSILAPLPVADAGAVPATTGAAGGPVRRGAGLRTSLRAWRERRTLLLGVVVMSAALSEGSANNWLAIAVVDGFAQTEAVAAVVFGTFVASMTVARISGTWLIDRYGRYLVVALSGATSLVGLVLFALAPALSWSVLGVVAWGLGAGLVIPVAMSAVSGDPLSAAGRVSVVSAFASAASIAAPPLIGLAAEAMGARHALLLITGVMLAGVLLAGAVREEGVGRTAPAATPPASDAAPAVPGPGDRVRPRRAPAGLAARDLADDDVLAELGGLVEPVGAASCR